MGGQAPTTVVIRAARGPVVVGAVSVVTRTVLWAGVLDQGRTVSATSGAAGGQVALSLTDPSAVDVVVNGQPRQLAGSAGPNGPFLLP